MTVLLNIALMNAVAVLPLALVAFLVSRGAGRPALTHAVWVLVLLKFITPPLFQLPVTIEVPAAHVSAEEAGPLASVPVQDVNRGSPAVNHDSIVAASPTDAARLERALTTNAPGPRIAGSQSDALAVVRAESPRVDRAASPILTNAMLTSTWKMYSTFWARRPELRSLLLTVWLAGAVLWATLQIVRAVRFQRRVLRDAIVSPELQHQTERLAAAMGLRRGPRVLIVDATVSPMLWGCGARSLLLFPSDLAARLDDDSRATLLTHELAHFARGDHWVRLLELIATGLFWWHPVVWWARRQIEEAEEECCDAWVVSQFPHAPRQYAEALLDTIDFLCESRPPLPPVACGLGQAHFLRHRLTKIMCGASPKALSQRVRYATALVAALLLPLQPFVFGSASVSSLRRENRSQPIVANIDSFPSQDAPSPSTSSTDDSPPVTSFAPETMSPAVVPASVPTARVRAARGEKIWSTAASPNGRFAVRATTARRIVLTDLTTNGETDLSSEQITAVAFAPDGEWFAAAGQDGRVTIWDAARGELLRTVQTHTDVLRSIAVSPLGESIAVGSRDGTVQMIDPVTGESLASLPTYSSAVNCVRFSSDGRQLAVAVGDWTSNGRGEVALLNSTTGQTLATLPCATSPGALTFVSNDELIVGLWDGRTQLWNLVNRHVVGSAMADKSVVSAAAFSPNNPALREAIFVAEAPITEDALSPLSLLRSLFSAPAK